MSIPTLQVLTLLFLLIVAVVARNCSNAFHLVKCLASHLALRLSNKQAKSEFERLTNFTKKGENKEKREGDKERLGEGEREGEGEKWRWREMLKKKKRRELTKRLERWK